MSELFRGQVSSFQHYLEVVALVVQIPKHYPTVIPPRHNSTKRANRCFTLTLVYLGFRL